MANIGPIKKYKIIASVATATDIATLPDSYKKLGMEIFVEDEQVVYLYNPETGTFPAPVVSSSPIIASGEVNLKDVGANVLTWTTGCSAANTVPTGVVVTMAENDTYVNQNIPGVQGTGSISIDSGINYTGLANGNATIRVNGVIISDAAFTYPTPATKADVINALIAGVQAGWTATSLGDVITFTEPVVEEGLNNGYPLVMSLNRITLTTSGATTITGGVAASATAYDLQLDGGQIYVNGGPFYPINLTASNFIAWPLVSTLNGYYFPNTGNWSIPVTIGTLNDFRIKIQILGVRID